MTRFAPAILTIVVLTPAVVLLWRSYRTTGRKSTKWQSITFATAALILACVLSAGAMGVRAATLGVAGYIGSGAILLLWLCTKLVQLAETRRR